MSNDPFSDLCPEDQKVLLDSIRRGIEAGLAPLAVQLTRLRDTIEQLYPDEVWHERMQAQKSGNQ